MPEFRQDPIVDRWVIIAKKRAERPVTTVDASLNNVDDNSYCPFCEGEEHATPKEVYAKRGEGKSPNGPGWSLRIVPNKFPALSSEGDADAMGEGLFRSVAGVGLHEVIIETPVHDISFGDMEADAVVDLFQAVIGRFRAFREDKRIVSVQFFKNHGAAAGASLPHPHSQIIGMPVVSRMVAEELAGAEKRYIENGVCPYCQIADHEVKTGERFVFKEGNILALAPYAPRFPYETLLLPSSHERDFDATDDETVVSLSMAIKKMVNIFDTLFDRPPYNLMLHTAPYNSTPSSCYHWHVRMMPVLGRTAGFEWGTGFHINPVPPEDAARLLRGKV